MDASSEFWANPARVAVVDFETTMSPDGLRAVELGIVFVERGEVAWAESWLVHPGCRIDGFSQSIHGIGDRDVVAAPSFPAVWAEVRPRLDGAVLLAHNAPFDSRVLQAEETRHGLAPGNPVWWCTLRLARRLWKGRYSSFRLAYLGDALQLEARSCHRGLGDAHAALDLFRVEARHACQLGYRELAELEPLACSGRGRPRIARKVAGRGSS